jgi:hypothetical protein
MKICTKCRHEQPLDQFHREKRNKDGHQRWCKDCSSEWRKAHRRVDSPYIQRQRQRKREWYRQNKEWHQFTGWRRALLVKYGLTLSDYADLLEAQDWCCALCGTDQPRGQGRWHVDHNHETGAIRGLLCNRCNRTLGIYEAFLSRIGKAVIERYLAIKEANATVAGAQMLKGKK